MRSFAEIRWARIMDSLGITYLYEPEVVSLGFCQYMPDFYLPNAGIYVEVKGPEPTEDERRKAEALICKKGRPVVFAYGEPDSDERGLFNSCFLVFSQGRWINIPAHYIDQVVLAALGQTQWLALVSAARPGSMPNTRSVGEYVRGYLANHDNRNLAEQFRRSINTPINASVAAGSPSMSEIGLRHWFSQEAP